jgi:hypothetical protein
MFSYESDKLELQNGDQNDPDAPNYGNLLIWT